MSDELELPPDPSARRAVVIFYNDENNTVEVHAEEFGWLELPELLRAALDYAEMNLPTFDLDESEPDQ